MLVFCGCLEIDVGVKLVILFLGVDIRNIDLKFMVWLEFGMIGIGVGLFVVLNFCEYFMVIFICNE